MLRQIRYFQAVVRNNSFTEAAEECHISQSAVSQQIQALERELGFALLERKNRKFALTPAGEYFYRKSLVLLADYERIRTEAAKLAHAGEAALHIGCLRGYGGREFRRPWICSPPNIRAFPSKLNRATTKNCLRACAPGEWTSRSATSAGRFPTNTSTAFCTRATALLKSRRAAPWRRWRRQRCRN